jgi:heat shock protein HtpX
MDFWTAQKKAKSKTKTYVALFIVLMLIAATVIEFLLRAMNPDYQQQFPFWGTVFIAVTTLIACFQYAMYKSQGGAYVAESLGARKIDPNTKDFYERQLLNIVNEVAIAASLPMPSVYIMDVDEINAFAAGTTNENAAVTVTKGCLRALNRDELQGVVAHEFGHVYNGDMLISMRLAAMIMGFFFIAYFGIRMLQISSFTGEERRGANPAVLIATAFMIAGAFTWFFGSILRASVSRQREYLADACAVQFTRNPDGIANALRKIGHYNKVNEMPANGNAYSHLYFDNHLGVSSLFATHPPLSKRIAAIEGREYIPAEWLEEPKDEPITLKTKGG